MIVRLLAATVLLQCASLSALYYRPWYSEPLLPYATLAYQVQTFPRVEGGGGSPLGHETAYTGLGNLSFSLTEKINIQTEAALTGTTEHSFFFDYATLFGRYLVLDDVIGDPFSLSVGVAVTVPSTTSRRDFATYHLGSVDFEAHAAIGKETVCGRYWLRRIWGIGAINWTTRSRPAFWGKLAAAYNGHNCYHLEAFVLGRLGLGARELTPFTEFDGYAPFRTRAVDIGGRVAYLGAPIGTFFLEYQFRPYARNYPQSAHFVVLACRFPLAI